MNKPLLRWRRCLSVVAAAVLLLALLACQGRTSQGLPAATPGLELQAEDYATARQSFRTKLLRKGPAPQSWQPVRVPAGVTQVEYTSGPLRLKAWVNPPPAGSAKKPAVLFLHGGWAFGADDWEMAEPFLAAGYVVMTPILRGENGQPGDFTMFYDEVDDVLAAADHLAKLPGVDAERLFVAGHSAGGTLTLLAALTSKRFRAAASFSGSPDRVKFAKETPFDPKDMEEMRMRSPVAYAASFKCPVRLYYGSKEDFFDADSRRTAMLAAEKGLDVKAEQVPGDHQSSVPEGMQRAIEFFKDR